MKSTSQMNDPKFRRIKKDVDIRLAHFFEAKASSSTKDGSIDQALHESLREFCTRGGKRMRAYLVFLGYRFSGGDVSVAGILDVACALELAHAAALIHDDVIDADTMRRGKPTLHEVFYANMPEDNVSEKARNATRRSATSLALLAADTLTGYSMELLAGAEITSEKKLEVARHLSHIAVLTGFGEAEDIYNAFYLDVHEETLHRILMLKTAKYTMSGPLVLGSMLASGSKKEQSFLEKIGDKLGMAFQLKDDALGIYGEVRLGKDAASDIREGKPIFLLRLVWSHLDAVTKKQIKVLFRKQEISPHETMRLRRIFLTTSGVSDSEELAKQYIEEAISDIYEFDADEKIKEDLGQLAQFAIERGI